MQREKEIIFSKTENEKKHWFRSFLNLFSILKIETSSKTNVIGASSLRPVSINSGSSKEFQDKLNEIHDEVDIHIKKDPKTEALKKKVDQILDNGLYHLYFEALRDGYTPSYSQQSKANKYLIQLAKTDLASLEQILKNGFHVNYDLVRELLYQDNIIEELQKSSNKNFFDNKNINAQIFSLPFLSREIRKVMTDEYYKEKFSKQFFTNFSTLIARIHNSEDSLSYPFLAETIIDFRVKFKACIETYPEIIFSNKYVDLDKYLIFLSQWQKNKDNFRNVIYLGLNRSKDTKEEKLNNIEETFNLITEKLIHYSKVGFSKEVNSIIGNTNTIVLNEDLNDSLDKNYYQLQLKTNIDDFPNISLDNLPEQAKSLLNDINKRYTNLKNYDLAIDKQSQIEIIIQKHLPKTINKYLIIMSIDEDLDIRNIDGKTPEELLLDSLNNINLSLKQHLLHIKESQIQELSAIHRHTQSFGK